MRATTNNIDHIVQPHFSRYISFCSGGKRRCSYLIHRKSRLFSFGWVGCSLAMPSESTVSNCCQLRGYARKTTERVQGGWTNLYRYRYLHTLHHGTTAYLGWRWWERWKSQLCMYYVINYSMFNNNFYFSPEMKAYHPTLAIISFDSFNNLMLTAGMHVHGKSQHTSIFGCWHMYITS